MEISQKWASILSMIFNFTSATGIIFVNKIITHSYSFHFSTFLSVFHFLVTWTGIFFCRRCGLYKKKELSPLQVFPLTCAFASFVVCNNLSLQYNSVGFYQLMKVMTTPVVLILQSVCYSVRMPFLLQLSLLPICIGVVMATVFDFSFNWAGFCWATAGLVATAFYQLLIKTRQAKLQVDSFQLLHYQVPQSFAVTLACTPLLDNLPALSQVEFTPRLLILLAISGIAAFCVNLSTYLVIVQTSPVSYQVLGHFKLVVILLVGVIVFHEDTNPVRLTGMGLALFGIITYSILKNHFESGWERFSSKEN